MAEQKMSARQVEFTVPRIIPGTGHTHPQNRHLIAEGYCQNSEKGTGLMDNLKYWSFLGSSSSSMRARLRANETEFS